MSTFSTDASSLTSRYLEDLPAILADARHSEIWGVDLENGEPQIVEKILRKVLNKNSALPSLQLPRAKASLIAALQSEGRLVLWVCLGEMVIKGHAYIYQNLETSNGILKLGLAVLEHISSQLIHSDTSLGGSLATYVIDFKIHAPNQSQGKRRQSQKKLIGALEKLTTVTRKYYPGIFHDALIIHPPAEYLATLDIPECLLENTVLLENPADLACHFGPQIYPESDVETSAQKTETADSKPKATTVEEVIAASPTNSGTELSVAVEPEHQEPRLIDSKTIGTPSVVFEPGDLQTADDVCPGNMGARLVFADSDIVVKFGHGARLTEAEALHLVSIRTSIAVPKLISAYGLDGVRYIAMSYEMGDPFEHYWDRDSIGRIDREPCRDGIFEAGYGDYTQYSYGPYPSEESFNEESVQALRDRLPKQVLQGENDKESVFLTAEYFLYQTVRGLKNHRIVLTHGDMHPGNLVVRADYWQFYRALFTASWRNSWERMVENFVPPYYVECSVINKVFTTVWN
ncbi:uncharacterized protein BJX67DRAFT_371757 [Aspergillus lucknowensis]|uniref:Aminoglycoside phosphotransferase domain-containing protein n=1 Tax=Aspergillus lucknowensis TaxID=176173 RepID=A0ABR4LT86_9EURO